MIPLVCHFLCYCKILCCGGGYWREWMHRLGCFWRGGRSRWAIRFNGVPRCLFPFAGIGKHQGNHFLSVFIGFCLRQDAVLCELGAFVRRWFVTAAAAALATTATAAVLVIISLLWAGWKYYHRCHGQVFVAEWLGCVSKFMDIDSCVCSTDHVKTISPPFFHPGSILPIYELSCSSDKVR